ncbi:SMEK domain-containing protein (plasmid) [Pantoea agglomerans]|uniref:SMEK domain-containing protein n=1 Tax=Enterobacter agglomerans TaxID=549 RepID=UPI0013C13AA8|nr:SMEK domain-containing protein [Pantoea agglomerans]NEH20624.1 SMEK domain-containing protein [Pantoea agglomerans]
MLQKKTSQDNVSFGLAVLNYYLRFNSKQNLQDANVASEELISELVNVLKDTNFRCTSDIKSNFPGIDALDKKNKLGLQISHSRTNKKINDTIDKIRDNNINSVIGTLYFFITSRKQKQYTIKSQCPGLNTVVDNILDFDDLSVLLSKDTSKLSRAENLLKDAMPLLYTDGKARYQVMLDCILVSRSQLDRQVFHAGRILEEPEDMLNSLTQIRIAIQKEGVLNKADVIVSAAFREIINLITSSEIEIAKNHNVGFKKYRAGVKPAWSYPDDRECVDILMNIRDDISEQIKLIDDEIEKLKKLVI